MMGNMLKKQDTAQSGPGVQQPQFVQQPGMQPMPAQYIQQPRPQFAQPQQQQSIFFQQPQFAPQQPQFPPQQPQFAPQQPQFAPQQPQFAPQQPQFPPQQPQFAPQQPQFAPQQPQFAPQQPQFAPQQPQYRPTPSFPQQGAFNPSYPSGGLSMSQFPGSSPVHMGQDNFQQSFDNDAMLASLTGWSMQDIQRLRHEFLSYANSYGAIDRDGFRRLYVASLLNMTWEALEHEAENAFRNFDVNQTGFLDFNEYVTACARLAREINMPQQSPPPPPMNQSFTY